jgi:uncharacterized RDD family membrane protein YckC
MAQMVGAGPVLQETYVISSVGRRFGAWIIDFIILLIASSVIAALLGGGQSSTRTFVGSDGSIMRNTVYTVEPVLTDSLLTVLSAIYAIPLWWRSGATFGQRMLGIQVLDVGGPTRLPLRRAAIRWFVLFSWLFLSVASQFINVLAWLVFIWLIAMLAATMRDGQKRGYQDRAAGSLVVSSVKYWAMPYAQQNLAPAPPAASVWH